MERVWYRHYEQGVPHDVPPSEGTVVDALYAAIFASLARGNPRQRVHEGAA